MAGETTTTYDGFPVIGFGISYCRYATIINPFEVNFHIHSPLFVH